MLVRGFGMVLLRGVGVAIVLVVIAALVVVVRALFPVVAQGNMPGFCDGAFGADANGVFQKVGAAIGVNDTQAADFAEMALDLATIRHKYEDLDAPPECADVQRKLVQLAALNSDVVFTNLITRLDTKNTATYTFFVQYTWQPRYDAFKASLSATPLPASTWAATAAATPSKVATEASVSGQCADAKYQRQALADLKSAAMPNMSNVSAIGNYGLALFKIRYQYEDTAAPAGCEAARKDLLKVLAVSQDLLTMAAAVQTDSDQATAFSNFAVKVLTPRGQKLYAAMQSTLGKPPLIPEMSPVP
jgi:hypothetical protein